MRYPSVKTKARFVLLTMLLGSTLGVFNASYRGGFFAYGDPSSYYEYADGGATKELAGGMLVLCQDSLEYTRSVLNDLEGEDSQYLTSAWEKLAKAEEQYEVAKIQMFEYLDYHASVQHSRRVLELCEEAVELASRIDVDGGDVLGGGASDYDLAWGAIERAYTLLNNLEESLSKLNDLDVSVVKSVLVDARGYIELAETQLTRGDLDAADGSVNEAMSLLGQAMDLLKYVSRIKKIDKVLTRAGEFDPIFSDVLDSLSSFGWLNESATQPLQEESDTLPEPEPAPEPEPEPAPEEKSNNGNPQNEKEPVFETEPAPEPEPEPAPEEKSNNGNPQNEKEPIVEPEPAPEPEDENEVSKLCLLYTSPSPRD